METIQVLGSLGEFIAAIAVVVTLVFLVFQIRQNTKALEMNQRVIAGQTVQARTDRWAERMEHFADSSHIAEIYERLHADGNDFDPAALDRLDPVERRRVWAWEMGQRSHMENVYHHHELGLDDLVSEESFLEIFRRRAPVWRALGVPINHPRLRELIEEELQEDPK